MSHWVNILMYAIVVVLTLLVIWNLYIVLRRKK